MCLDEDICKLYCIAEDFDFFFAMSSKVKDGTSCSDHGGDVCIDGVCEVQCLYPVLTFGRMSEITGTHLILSDLTCITKGLLYHSVLSSMLHQVYSATHLSILM